MEEFYILKEIMSLDQKQAVHLAAIAEQEKRMQVLENQGQQRQKALAEVNGTLLKLNQELQIKESELAKNQQRRVQMQEQHSHITSSSALAAWEHEEQLVKTKTAQAETEIFQQLEEQEALVGKKTDLEKFLSGWQESWKEIKTEVEQLVAQNRQDHAQLEERKLSRLHTLPPTMQRIYQKAQLKHPHGLPFTWDQAGSCSACAYQMTSQDREQIELGNQVDSCRGCGRIFLPHKVVKNY